MYCALAREYGWGPDVVSELTDAQKIMYLDDIKTQQDQAAGSRGTSYGDYDENDPASCEEHARRVAEKFGVIPDGN